MTIYLINPSHVSFGIGVITPRWLYVLAAATPESAGGSSSSTRRWSRSTERARSPATWSASASIRATRCGATRSGARRARPGAHVIFGGIHATLYPGRGARHGRRARRRERRRRDGVARGAARLPPGSSGRDTTAGASKGTRSCPAAGTCCPSGGTCGRRCRPCAAARSTARSVPSGAPTGRSPGSATWTQSCRRSSSCGAAASASSRSPTTISTR
jgi:hypothetical protein